MWMLAAVPFVTLPLFILGLLAGDLSTAIALFIIPGFAANYAIGPTIAMIQTLSPPPHARSVCGHQDVAAKPYWNGFGPTLGGGYQ